MVVDTSYVLLATPRTEDEHLPSCSSSFVVESRLPEGNFVQVMRQLFFFDSQIKPSITELNAIYKWTCGKLDCKLDCQVPHLMLIIRIGWGAEDQVGIIHQSAANGALVNLAPLDPRKCGTYKAWERARWHIVRRLLVCLMVHYANGDGERIRRHLSKPIPVYALGRITSKLLDLQKRMLLAKSGFEVGELESYMEQHEEGDDLDVLLKGFA